MGRDAGVDEAPGRGVLSSFMVAGLKSRGGKGENEINV
jgi:hypothetical protein